MSDRIGIDGTIEGKRVVDADGEDVGIVTGVRGDTVYVDTDPGTTDAVLSRLGWQSADRGDYPLETAAIERVTGDEVLLSGGTKS